MTSNAELTQEYFDIMTDLDGDIPSRRAAQTYMQNSTAVYHHEVVASGFVPRLFNRETYAALEKTATTMHTILCKVMRQYLENEDYRRVFKLDPRLQELILLPRGYEALLPFARVDIFLNEDDYTTAFCEFNADGSSGMNEDREVVASITGSESFQRFAQRYAVKSCEFFDSWVSEFLAIYQSYEHAVSNPHIAICDFLENAVYDEFEIYRDYFARRGITCSIQDVRDLRFDGEKLSGKEGLRIDAIWRRSVTNDIIDHWEESRSLIDAVRGEKVALIGSFAGHLVHDKQIFRVLHLPETKAFLTPEEAAFIEATLPLTAFLDSEHLDLEEVKTHKDKWIIKPTDHYGADEVHAGCYWNQAQWNALIDKFANTAAGIPFLAQKYCTPFKTLTLPPDEGIEALHDAEVTREGTSYNNLSGLYLYNGRFVGVFSRLGPKPTICKDMQGITAATIWVDA